jgi:hypothetical protein
MRLIALIMAAFVISGPAAAQAWKEYNYPDYAFSVTFPADPQLETTTYQVANGRSVPAHVYSVRQNNGVFKVTIAELGNSGVQESAVIDSAVKTLSQGGEVKVDFPHRINQVYGRQHSGSRRQPLDGRGIRHQWAAIPDRGQNPPRRQRHGPHSVSAVADLRPQSLEPLRGYGSRNPRGMSRGRQQPRRAGRSALRAQIKSRRCIARRIRGRGARKKHAPLIELRSIAPRARPAPVG